MPWVVLPRAKARYVGCQLIAFSQQRMTGTLEDPTPLAPKYFEGGKEAINGMGETREVLLCSNHTV